MTSQPKVLIVGAGAVGIIYGYILTLANVEVTFLIRPHRAEALSRPQVLYSYNEHTLETYSQYKLITDPSKISEVEYDYILTTLDGAALSNDVGISLVKTIGDAVRGKKTRVLLGSILLNLKSWFLETSGLAEEQVTACGFTIHIYSPKLVDLPQNTPTDTKLLAQADWAYADKFPTSFMIDASAPELAKSFAELYDRNSITKSSVLPTEQCNLFFMMFFPVFAASELLGWPHFADIDATSSVWKVTTAAVKEMQGLSICGAAGLEAAKTTTEEGIKAQLVGMEQMMLPLEHQAFNRYHHGGKVLAQDMKLLRECVGFGEKERREMGALKELLRLVGEKTNGRNK